VNNEMERIWKEVTVAHFKVLKACLGLSGGTEETYGNLSLDNLSLGTRFKPPEYELTNTPTRRLVRALDKGSETTR
jgi:hypothetical protein